MGKIIGEQTASEEQVGSGELCLRLSSGRTKISHAGREARSGKGWFLFLSHLTVSQIIVSKESTTPWNSRRGRSLSWLMGVADIRCIALTRRGRCYL